MLLLVAATDAELCGHAGLVCGVGPVEAAAATARALTRQPVAAVLHIGLAGGPNPGEIVIGSEASYVDLRANWPVVDRAEPDARLVEAVRRVLPAAPLVPILTSATVGRSRNRAGGLVEAMEGFGVIRACALAGVPAVEVRAVSNEVGEEDRSSWRIAEALAALSEALPRLLVAIDEVVSVRRGEG